MHYGRYGNNMLDLDFYKNKKVLITGHTGFKGTWLCKILVDAGADVIGYSLNPPTTPSLFEEIKLEKKITSIIGDIRDFKHLEEVFQKYKPEIVIHMAAQPIVRTSYEEPVYTYETNVMGTVNVLECVRNSKSVKSFLNVTTDKVYKNKEWEWGYREDEYLDGYDPYSNSKSCSELVTHSYKNSFFIDNNVSISTARAGNVIGGGDFAKDRIIPDSVKAAINGEKIIVRNPYSIRPYQHVLEPLFAYLMIAQKQYENKNFEGYYNIGPDECNCITTGKITDLFCKYWGENLEWEDISQENAPHEATFLKLDCSKFKSKYRWTPTWDVEKAVEKTVEFSKAYKDGQDLNEIMQKQILEFINESEW